MRATLAALDGNSLVAHLATIKERIVADQRGRPFAEQAETTAVIDECAVRLLGPGTTSQVAEVEHLRELIRAVVAFGRDATVSHCPLCDPDGIIGCGGCHEKGAHAHHVLEDENGPGCPWPDLVREVEKP